jgi:hypothetical protein
MPQVKNILKLDFERAFDKVENSFILKVLDDPQVYGITTVFEGSKTQIY